MLKSGRIKPLLSIVLAVVLVLLKVHDDVVLVGYGVARVGKVLAESRLAKKR
jgi:hypothetical protein